MIRIVPFEKLTNEELYSIMRLRQEVFVVEQDCPYIDADNLDQSAHHLLLEKNEQLIGYARLLPKGTSYPEFCSIGRVISHGQHRGQGIGRDVMNASIEFCTSQWPEQSIKISAQVYALKFYSSLGFETLGSTYLEDGIPHTSMVYKTI